MLPPEFASHHNTNKPSHPRVISHVNECRGVMVLGTTLAETTLAIVDVGRIDLGSGFDRNGVAGFNDQSRFQRRADWPMWTVCDSASACIRQRSTVTS